MLLVTLSRCARRRRATTMASRTPAGRRRPPPNHVGHIWASHHLAERRGDLAAQGLLVTSPGRRRTAPTSRSAASRQRRR